MSDENVLVGILKDLEEKLEVEIENSDYYLKRFKESEEKIIQIKKTLHDLKEWSSK